MTHEWWMPVNANPGQVRRWETGPTRAVEPTEAAEFLPVYELCYWMAWPNRTYLRSKDAHHFTALPWPA